MSEATVAVIGGDRRIACMIPMLREKGFRVNCHGVQVYPEQKIKPFSELKEAVKTADIILGGIPLFRGADFTSGELLEAFRDSGGSAVSAGSEISTENAGAGLERAGKMLFGGVIDQEFRDQALELGVVCYDFMKVETIVLFNAIATAEGAIAEAIRNQDTNLHKSKCLVLGYGRCGRVLAEKLKGLDAQVTVCCRRDTQLAQAYAFGCGIVPLEDLEGEIGGYEYIFNTIPKVILGERQLRKMSPKALAVDLASGKGGIDFETADRLGIHALACLGLPGRYAPESSARVLADYVEMVSTVVVSTAAVSTAAGGVLENRETEASDGCSLDANCNSQ